MFNTTDEIYYTVAFCLLIGWGIGFITGWLTSNRRLDKAMRSVEEVIYDRKRIL